MMCVLVSLAVHVCARADGVVEVAAGPTGGVRHDGRMPCSLQLPDSRQQRAAIVALAERQWDMGERLLYWDVAVAGSPTSDGGGGALVVANFRDGTTQPPAIRTAQDWLSQRWADAHRRGIAIAQRPKIRLLVVAVSGEVRRIWPVVPDEAWEKDASGKVVLPLGSRPLIPDEYAGASKRSAPSATNGPRPPAKSIWRPRRVCWRSWLSETAHTVTPVDRRARVPPR